jgi:hypothetical protein
MVRRSLVLLATACLSTGCGDASEPDALVCAPRVRTCVDIQTLSVCNDDGSAIETTACAPEEFCDTTAFGGGACAPDICTAGSIACEDGTTLVTCDASGSAVTRSVCQDGCSTSVESCNACGDDEAVGGEECDGDDLRAATCQSLPDPASPGDTFEAGELGCDPTSCRYDTSLCTRCGDDVIQGAEQCDGGDLAGIDCTTLNDCFGIAFDGGTLACYDPVTAPELDQCGAATSACAFDTRGCHRCGNLLREATEECDGFDLGGASCALVVPCSGGGICDPAIGTLGCSSFCTFNLASCQRCGNDIREGAEECDGADQAGATCATRGFEVGAIGCWPAATEESPDEVNCSLNTTGCSYSCNGVCKAPGECNADPCGGGTPDCHTSRFDPGQAPCCGDGSCSSRLGEDADNCPLDCA